MKKSLLITFIAGLFTLQAHAQLVDGTPAPVPPVPGIYNAEPWEDPLVTSINRDPARATAYSYRSVQEALGGDRDKSRMLLQRITCTDTLFSPSCKYGVTLNSEGRKLSSP